MRFLFKTAMVVYSDNEEENYQGEIVIPEVIIYEREEFAVTGIVGLTFYGCGGITSITIPKSVTYIGRDTFCHCSGLKSIIVTRDNEKYDSRNNCNAIIETDSNTLIVGCSTTIIPKCVTKIRDLAFCGCKGLTSITIPENVEDIGCFTFYGCSSLKEIYCYNFSKNWNDAFDESLVGDVTIYVHAHAIGYVQNSFKKIVPIEAKI